MKNKLLFLSMLFWALNCKAQSRTLIKEGDYRCVANYYDTNRILTIQYLDNSNFLFIVAKKNKPFGNSIYSQNSYFGIGKKSTHNNLVGLVDETPRNEYINAKYRKANAVTVKYFRNRNIFSYVNDTLTIDYTDGRCFICGKYIFEDSNSNIDYSSIKTYSRFPLLNSLGVSIQKRVELFSLPMRLKPKQQFLSPGEVVYLQEVYMDDFFVIEFDKSNSIKRFGWINSNAVHYLPETPCSR